MCIRDSYNILHQIFYTTWEFFTPPALVPLVPFSISGPTIHWSRDQSILFWRRLHWVSPVCTLCTVYCSQHFTTLVVYMSNDDNRQKNQWRLFFPGNSFLWFFFFETMLLLFFRDSMGKNSLMVLCHIKAISIILCLGINKPSYVVFNVIAVS